MDNKIKNKIKDIIRETLKLEDTAGPVQLSLDVFKKLYIPKHFPATKFNDQTFKGSKKFKKTYKDDPDEFFGALAAIAEPKGTLGADDIEKLEINKITPAIANMLQVLQSLGAGDDKEAVQKHEFDNLFSDEQLIDLTYDELDQRQKDFNDSRENQNLERITNFYNWYINKRNDIARTAMSGIVSTGLEQIAAAAKVKLEEFNSGIETQSKLKQTSFDKRFVPTEISRAEFDPEDKIVIDKLLNTPDLKERFSKASEFTKKLYESAAKGTHLGMTTSELVLTAQFLDIVSALVKTYKVGAAAPLFEGVLAMIGGGSVEGRSLTVAKKKADTLTKIGNIRAAMGAVDFTFNVDGIQKNGSAKYVAAGQVSQALNGFLDLIEKEGQGNEETGYETSLTYVVTQKSAAFDEVLATSEPAHIVVLNVFIFDVKYNHITGYSIGDTTIESNPKKNLKFNVNDDTDLQPIKLYLSSDLTSTTKQMIEKAVTKADTDAATAFNAFRDYVDLINESEEKTRVFTASKSSTTAAEAATALEKAEAKLETVVRLLSNSGNDTESVEDGSPTADPNSQPSQLAEKITANFLKKLISESFKS